MSTDITTTATAARERHRDPAGRFGRQPAAESDTVLAQPSTEPVDVPAHVLDFAAQSGWDTDQVQAMYASSVRRAAEKDPPEATKLARQWKSFCTGRARKAQDRDLADDYTELAAHPPEPDEAMATMRMNDREHRARRSMDSITADLSATRGVSRREFDDYVAAARAQYQDTLAELPDDQRPCPPQEWVTGLRSCWPQRSLPGDPATLYALYRAEADPDAFPARTRSFASVDLETAGPNGKEGFDPVHGCIIEVGVVRYDETGSVTATYSQLVHPMPAAQESYRTGAVNIHGITWDDVADAPPWEQVAPQTSAALSRATLVAHNAKFEKKWLGHHLPGFDENTPTVDTLLLAQRNYGNLESHQLGAMCEYFGVDYTAGHRAEHDARVAAEMLFAARADITDRYTADPAFAGLPDPRTGAGPGHAPSSRHP
ncbi:PolC-type DNA polymerase III [Ornithinimicrobium murale]|uniref:3'-5' exonuclease n=1 Tax=Ornithinimicrobium murale TaxID=1050153 RepID=UPI000E0DF37F|nr:3'-5' exonuclease [Ornithinimicrobium murale]